MKHLIRSGMNVCVGVALLAALPALAQNDTRSATDEFERLDTNNDGRLNWRELTQQMKEPLTEVDLTEDEVLKTYDQNQDRYLSENEYYAFRREMVEEQDIPIGEQPGSEGVKVVEGRVRVVEVDQTPIEEVMGRPVLSRDGEQLGQSEDVVASEKGETGLLVDTGNRRVVMDLDELRLTEDGVVWEMADDAGALSDLPDYNPSDYVSAR